MGRRIRYPIAVMFSLRRPRARRVPALIASLALFVMGSNFCVLSALSGDTRMACMAMPSDASSAAVPACHRAAPATDSRSDEPVPTPSCCPKPAIAPASVTVAQAADAFTTLEDALFATVIPVASPDVIDLHGHRPSPDGQPPTRLTRAPAPARGPPFS